MLTMMVLMMTVRVMSTTAASESEREGEKEKERERGKGRARARGRAIYIYIEREKERVIQVCLDRPKRDSAHDGEWTIEGTHRHVETEGERLKYSNERFGGASRVPLGNATGVSFQLHSSCILLKRHFCLRKTYNKHKRAHAQLAVPEVNRKLAFGRNQITSTTVQTSR